MGYEEMSYSQLFAVADEIGNKYQSEQEWARNTLLIGDAEWTLRETIEAIEAEAEEEAELTLADLERQEAALKAALFRMGGTEIDWARLCLECQFSDLHIEEL